MPRLNEQFEINAVKCSYKPIIFVWNSKNAVRFFLNELLKYFYFIELLFRVRVFNLPSIAANRFSDIYILLRLEFRGWNYWIPPFLNEEIKKIIKSVEEPQ